MLAQLPNNGVGFEQPSLMNGDNADNGEHAELTMLTTEDNESLSNATQELCVERASEPVQDATEHAGNTTEKRLLRPVTVRNDGKNHGRPRGGAGHLNENVVS